MSKRALTIGIIVVVAIAGIFLWVNREKESQADLVSQSEEVLADLAFFQEKLDAGQWVMGSRVAAEARRAFDVTGNTIYLDQAEEAIKIHLEHEASPAAYAHQSAIDLTWHRFDSAKTNAESAIENAHLDEDLESAYTALISADLGLGNFKAAKQTLIKLRAISGEDNFNYHILTAHYESRVSGNHIAAADHFTQACNQLDNTDPWLVAWCITNQVHYQLLAGGDLIELGNELEAVIEANPNFEPAILLRGRIAELNSHPETAIFWYEQSDATFEIAEVQNALGDIDGAYSSFANFLDTAEIDPLEKLHTYDRIISLIETNQPKEAIAVAQADHTTRPNSPEANHNLAIAYFLTGQPFDAVESSEQISATVVLTGEEAHVRALAMQELNLPEEADPLFTTANANARAIRLRFSHHTN